MVGIVTGNLCVIIKYRKYKQENTGAYILCKVPLVFAFRFLKLNTKGALQSTVKDNSIASFPSTKLYLDVGRLLVSSFFFTSPRLSSYFLYFIKMSFHHINESQKKNNGSSP